LVFRLVLPVRISFGLSLMLLSLSLAFLIGLIIHANGVMLNVVMIPDFFSMTISRPVLRMTFSCFLVLHGVS
jgi:hypothetical protein